MKLRTYPNKRSGGGGSKGALAILRLDGEPAHCLKNRALDANKFTMRVSLHSQVQGQHVLGRGSILNINNHKGT